MATNKFQIVGEIDLINDAIADIERIFDGLAKCHGADYRELERRIEYLFDGGEFSLPEAHWLGGGRITLEPPEEFKAIISDARRLGVI